MQARHSGEPVAADWDRAHWISYADLLLAGPMALAPRSHADHLARCGLTAVLGWPDGAATVSRLPESPIVPFESVMSAGPVTDPEQV